MLYSLWHFHFAVTFLFCHGFFNLPQQFLSCRDFFILPWLFCFVVAFWFCRDTYGPPYCLYYTIRKSKKSRWVFYGNLKVILGTGCLIFCAGKGASKLIYWSIYEGPQALFVKQAALNIVPSSIISKCVGSKFSVGPYKSVLSSSGAGFGCFPLTRL